MNADDEKWIADIESGDVTAAFEAVKKIAHRDLSKDDIDRIARIAGSGAALHNRAAATGVLGHIDNRNAALTVLIDLLGAPEQHEAVRGFAAEGIAAQRPPLRSKLRKKAEDVLMQALRDPSPTVRFWACYAVGQLGMKKALAVLDELKTNDGGLCPGWWYVSEEAADAVEWIKGRAGEARVPVHERTSGN
jgi:HEAT repeat protein